ncbi:hypothetical protein NPIL_304821 [Nephila pilipes]|uniref:Uncharacterized protein n=1 Tax=Nephila pilipes TaxID=299642 RepID=A0A8X6PQC3_NEPPI|nr:hypothetical protein NPIL_304821 [Nephila pilipes]
MNHLPITKFFSSCDNKVSFVSAGILLKFGKVNNNNQKELRHLKQMKRRNLGIVSTLGVPEKKVTDLTFSSTIEIKILRLLSNHSKREEAYHLQIKEAADGRRKGEGIID